MRKDVFLILYSIYCIALSYELVIADIYRVDYPVLFYAVIPAILLLDEGLKRLERNFFTYSIVGIIVAGLFFREIFFAGIILAVIHDFYRDYPRRGPLAVVTGIFMVVAGVVLARNLMEQMGGTATQVVFVAGLTIISAIVFWRRVRVAEF